MQRFFTLIGLLLFALPVGLSVTGCATNVSAYCNSAGYGPKLGEIFSVRFPQGQSSVGLSLSYGQSAQAPTPVATDCRNTTVSTGAATYGSSNLQMADISPTGSVCAGTWNRLSAGGIPDYTICTPPTTPGTATITASLGGVTSNPFTVYVHPQISGIAIGTQASCIPSGQPGPNLLSGTSVFGTDGVLLQASGTGNSVGTITYTANTPDIVTINNTNVSSGGTTAGGALGTTIANQPGGTVITATVAGLSGNAAATSSAAGYFYTCPPAKVALSLASSNGGINSDGSVTVTAGNPQTINSVLTDATGTTITPLAGTGPDFTSNLPQQVQVTTGGVVSSALPGIASVTGICQPGAATTSTTTSSSTSSSATGSNCNPTPLNVLGTFGTGLPITGNLLKVRSPGVNNTQLWAASPQSQFFTPFDLALSQSGQPVLLPYQPNSMVLDPTTTSLYFGSYRELMIYSAANNTLAAQDTTVPGVVLAVSPSNTQVVIADQLRRVIYLYTPAVRSTTSGSTATTNASVISTGGLATHAVYSQDGKNVYIVGLNALYVHNVVSGWSQYPLTSADPTASCALDNTGSTPFCSPDVALTLPSVAAFISGAPVTARSYCPDTTTNPVTYNPLAATVTGSSAQHLAATPDGLHIVGASTTGVSDIVHSPSGDASQLVAPIGPCPGVIAGTAGPLQIQTTLQQLAYTGITPTQIDQVLSSPDSSKAFVTYQAAAASGILPLYTPSATAGTPGALTNVQLTAGAQAPIAGVFSPDASLFFASTTGDNLIHIVNTATDKDQQQLNPQLTTTNGQAVPAQFLQTRARPTT